jgi:predicted permease
MQTLLEDLRIARRTLLRAPVFTSVAVLSIAIGVGANTAIYSLIEALFLRAPEGLARAHELVAFHHVERRGGETWWEFASYPDYVYYRDHASVFSGLASHFGFTGVDSAAGQEVAGSVVSANYFAVLGIAPHLGRFFTLDEDEVLDRDRVVVVSHRFWQRRLAGDPDCLGQSFVLNGTPLTIVGIAPPSFHGAIVAGYDDVWIPTMAARVAFRRMNVLERGSSGDQSPLRLVGRLRPGLKFADARAELALLTSQLHAAYPDAHPWSGVALYSVDGLRPERRPEHARLALVLSAATTGLLVITCANLAGLLLARSPARRREIGTRIALGARRSRLFRLLMTESLVLSLAGGVLGFLAASWFAALLEAYYPAELRLRVDGPAVIANALLTFATAGAFGLWPAWRTSRLHPVSVMREHVPALGSPRSLLQSTFVVVQIAGCMALLVGAGLLVQSRKTLVNLPGFDSSKVLYLQLKPHLSGYDAGQQKAYFKEVQRRVEALPGVRSAAFALRPPLLGQQLPEVPVSLPGTPARLAHDALRVKQNVVTPRFFQTLAIPFLRGTGFQDRDLESGHAVVVNDILASRLWPGRDALGRTLVVGNEPHQVVGIVRYDNFQRTREGPSPFLFRAGLAGNRMLIRVDREPLAMLALLRREVRSVDPTAAVTSERPLTDMLRESFTPVTLAMSVLSSAGGLALLLSLVGIYGVLAIAVAQRTREIGIRMALGAAPSAVMALVMRDGTRLLLIGVALGMPATAAFSRAVSNYLHGVTGHDAFTFATVTLMLGLVGTFACYVPAKRAATLDPTQALRRD